MRNITNVSVTTILANITGTVRNVVVGVGTSFALALRDAQFILKRLAKPATDGMVAVRVYRDCTRSGRRPMSMHMDRVHSWTPGQQGGSWSESAVRNRF